MLNLLVLATTAFSSSATARDYTGLSQRQSKSWETRLQVVTPNQFKQKYGICTQFLSLLNSVRFPLYHVYIMPDLSIFSFSTVTRAEKLSSSTTSADICESNLFLVQKPYKITIMLNRCKSKNFTGVRTLN